MRSNCILPISKRIGWIERCKNYTTEAICNNKPNSQSNDNYISTTSDTTKDIVKNGAVLIPNFITEEEESCLLKDIQPRWRRLKYQYAHWDGAIHGYRETEMSLQKWSKKSQEIIKRAHEISFDNEDKIKNLVHVLDLNGDGYIKPHVDSIKFCGRVITGISLLSSAVMRLIDENDKSQMVDMHVERRSLYIIKHELRYNYTHEILKDEESYFKGKRIPKGRRIAVICRSESLIPQSNNPFHTKVVSIDETET